MKQELTSKETIALAAATKGIEMAYMTEEIVDMVAEELNVSFNSAKGYIGKLTQKGYIVKHRQVINGEVIIQFTIA